MLLSAPTFCQQIINPDKSNDVFLKQILNLKEYKFEEHKIDSLVKVKSAPNVISISIVKGYLMTTDSLNDLSTGFINEGLRTPNGGSMDEQMIYTIKFDNKKKKIISVGDYRPWQ